MIPGNSLMTAPPRKSVLVPGWRDGLKPAVFCCRSVVPDAVMQKNSSRPIGMPGNLRVVAVAVPVAIGFRQSEVVDTNAAVMPLKLPGMTIVAVSLVDNELRAAVGVSTATLPVAASTVAASLAVAAITMVAVSGLLRNSSPKVGAFRSMN